MTSQDLDAYVCHLLDSDRMVRRLTRDILRAQKKLRGEVGDGAWRTYLRLEAMVNHRHDEILRKVAERLGWSG